MQINTEARPESRQKTAMLLDDSAFGDPPDSQAHFASLDTSLSFTDADASQYVSVHTDEAQVCASRWACSSRKRTITWYH